MSETKKLSAEEIAFLHSFCKKKDIVLVDLRIELVDHLAEQILAYQEKHPATNFKDALFAVYKSYGIFGFMDIAAAHQKQMEKRYWREIWNYTKTWITPPRVLLTICLAAGIYFLADLVESSRVPLLWFGLALFVLSAVLTVNQFLNNKQILGGEQSVLMAGAKSGGFGIFTYLLLYLPMQGFWINPGKNSELIFHPIYLSIFIVCTCIFGLANYFIQEKASVQLHEIKRQLV